MKKPSTNSEHDLPVLTREQLGDGVRGKYFSRYTQASNVVVLKPEILKAFPNSEAVNKALATMLAFMQEASGLTAPAARVSAKRASVQGT